MKQSFHSLTKGIFISSIILFGCSSKKNAVEKENDTIAAKMDTVIVKDDIVNINVDFPLDSLLSFDSEAALLISFGKEDVVRSVGYYPEDMGQYPNTLLFPKTNNEVEFIWRDTIDFKALNQITVSHVNANWATTDGVRMGTTLRELEKLNQKPFKFNGFGWDYSGMVDWDGGHLDDRKVFVTLDYPGQSMPSEFEELLGDQLINSNSEVSQKANPTVHEIRMMK